MPPPNPITAKLRMALKLSISRLRTTHQKQLALTKQSRRTLSTLLSTVPPQYLVTPPTPNPLNAPMSLTSARIRCEPLIATDIYIELLEMLELYCELLLARISLLDNISGPLHSSSAQGGAGNSVGNQLDPALHEAISTLIYAAQRTSIKELQQARDLLVQKLGKEFALAAAENRDGKVAERVIKKLRMEPPSEELVTLYLKEIARTYGIPWGDDEGEGTPGAPPPPPDDDEPTTKIPAVDVLAETEDPVATELVSKAASPPKQVLPKSPIHVAPASPTTENLHPVIKFPDAPALKPMPSVSQPSVSQQRTGGGMAGVKKPAVSLQDDDLLRRFEALKRR
ncbi:regulator of Vps4 activity in the MVB pathway-domain-containing protein [Kalaharituber pfeilii]|nr:regulator of Vps4 activity in the MVB pathway-domain-containing protein [Kalaharituber pfeilii]